MSKVNRRTVLKGVSASGLAFSGLAALSEPVIAASESVGCDADSKHGVSTVGDSDNDGAAYVNSSTGTQYQHYYSITAEADIYDSPDCCKGEKTTTTLYQERKDCDDGSTYWSNVSSVAACCKCECTDSNSDDGYVSTSGSGWVATGDYKMKVKSVLFDAGDSNCSNPGSGDGCYTWETNSETCTEYFTINDDLDACGNIQSVDS